MVEPLPQPGPDEPPPVEWDWMPPDAPPPWLDEEAPDFSLPEPPYPDEYAPLPPDGGPTLPIARPVAPDQAALPGFASEAPAAESPFGWQWADARLLVEQQTAADGSTVCTVGCVDVYRHLQTGDLGGSYLEIGRFETAAEAVELYDDLTERASELDVALDELPGLAEYAAYQGVDAGVTAPEWRSMTPDQYAAYEWSAGLSAGDTPPPQLVDDLLLDAYRLGGVSVEPEVTPQGNEPDVAAALRAIGLQASGFDPALDPPPFYDVETDTAYWIGVYQPNLEDTEFGVASILSLARDETGAYAAQLAPCVPGDLDKATQACELLIAAAERGGIEYCFDVAEGMALAADQRDFWDGERGVSLPLAEAQAIGDAVEQQWEPGR